MEILLTSRVTATCAQLMAFDRLGIFGGSYLQSRWNFTVVDAGTLDLAHSLPRSGSVALTASDFGNELGGTANNDDLLGGKAGDTLKGRSGSDFLNGGGGDDILIGGAGQDQMFGGAGDDTYYVDGTDDVQDNRGFDRVFSSGSFEIYVSSLRTLTLTGRSASNGAGNERNNLIIGNAAANRLTGFDGADTLRGGAGNDTLYGGVGKDLLTGGKGNDEFVFSGQGSLPSKNHDKITDFNHRHDTIDLEAAIMGRLYDNGMHTLKPAFFHVGAAAADTNDYIVYNQKNGHLYYDDNGSGHGGTYLLAILTNRPTLEANDFHVI
jgi:Ca2+-binding RTX toxin-like protein